MTTQFWKAWQQLKHLQGTSVFPVLFTSAQALWRLLVEFALHLPPVLAAEELAVVPGKAVSSQPLQSAQDLTHGPRTLSGATQTSENWGSVGRSCCTPCPCPARSLSLPPRPWAPACFAEREQVNLHTTSKISGSCPCSCPPRSLGLHNPPTIGHCHTLQYHQVGKGPSTSSAPGPPRGSCAAHVVFLPAAAPFHQASWTGRSTPAQHSVLQKAALLSYYPELLTGCSVPGNG